MRGDKGLKSDGDEGSKGATGGAYYDDITNGHNVDCTWAESSNVLVSW